MSPQVIRIAKSGARNAPTLPRDAVTRTFGIFGMKDSGKTTTGRVLVEGICGVGGHVIVFDPVGVWWGATRAGEGPGLPGVVIGGEHGDVPLEETGGHVVAELALARQYKLIVVDMKLLRKGAARRFAADCLEELYFRNRLPLMVVFEEADQTLPQNPRGMDPTLGRVLGAAEDIVKLGRSRGLGSSLISQRFATVNKNVTEQIESLILLRLIGPKDRKAAAEWIESNGDPRVTAKVLDSLASLERGEAWLYSPGWLRLLERLRIRMARTLDSSATPTLEQQQAQEEAPRAPVSLESLRGQMAATVKRAEESDPRKLRQRIEELEVELAEAHATTPEPVREAVWPFSDEEVEAAIGAAEHAMAECAGARTVMEEVVRQANDAKRRGELGEERMERVLQALREWGARRDASATSIDELIVKVTGNRIAPARPTPAKRKAPAPGGGAEWAERQEQEQRAVAEGNGELSGGARRLLEDMRGIFPLRLSRSQLALILKRGARSSTLTQQLSELQRAGLIDAERGRYGARMGGDVELSPQEAVERWRGALPDGPRAMFEVLLEGGVWTREELFTRAGFSPTSSTPVGHLKLLVDNGLADRSDGSVQLGHEVR